MLEPAAAMAWGDAIASTSGDSPKGFSVARCVSTDILLLERPARLDGVQIRRVRRKVNEVDAASRARGRNARVVVRGQVVHDEHIVRTKLREKDGLEPSNESLLVGRREHGGECHPAGQSDRPENRQVLPPVHRHSVDELVAALHPGVGSTHGDVHARFVDENEPIRGNFADSAQELPTLHFDVGPQTFQRPAAFFFTTYP